MFQQDLFLELLRLEDHWEPAQFHYSRATATLTVDVKLMDGIWERQACPKCRSQRISPSKGGEKRTWRHVDGFNVKTLIECAVPGARCQECSHIFRVEPHWRGKSRHYTKSFETFALNIMKETTVKAASKLLGESDQKLWRMLFAYAEDGEGVLSDLAISIVHREWEKIGWTS